MCAWVVVTVAIASALFLLLARRVMLVVTVARAACVLAMFLHHFLRQWPLVTYLRLLYLW